MVKYFLYPDDPGAGALTPDSDSGAGAPTPDSDPGAGAPDKVTPEKKYTDDDVSNVVAKETAKERRKLLKKLGVEDDKGLQGIIDALAAMKQTAQVGETAEQTAVRLSQELQAAQQTIEKLTTRVTAFENTQYLTGLGVFDEADIPAQCTYITQLAKDGDMTFEEAAKGYIKDRPKKTTKVPASATFGGTGKTPVQGVDKDAFGKMTYLEKLKLKTDSPEVYAKLMKG